MRMRLEGSVRTYLIRQRLHQQRSPTCFPQSLFPAAHHSRLWLPPCPLSDPTHLQFSEFRLYRQSRQSSCEMLIKTYNIHSQSWVSWNLGYIMEYRVNNFLTFCDLSTVNTPGSCQVLSQCCIWLSQRLLDSFISCKYRHPIQGKCDAHACSECRCHSHGPYLTWSVYHVFFLHWSRKLGSLITISWSTVASHILWESSEIKGH